MHDSKDQLGLNITAQITAHLQVETTVFPLLASQRSFGSSDTK